MIGNKSLFQAPERKKKKKICKGLWDWSAMRAKLLGNCRGCCRTVFTIRYLYFSAPKDEFSSGIFLR